MESIENEGSEFILHLPVTHHAADSVVPDQVAKPVSIENSMTESSIVNEYKSKEEDLPVLLIVEDNPDVTEYLISLLEKEYTITCAENGKAGLGKALELVPDIILSDVMMPEIDGIEMLSLLKKDMRTSHIPVILLTAKADVASRLEGFETGAEVYLEKPFHKEELSIRLRKLIELRKILKE